jgi:hypothetical protein
MPGFRSVDAAHVRRAALWGSGPVAALVLAAGCVAAPSSGGPSAAPAVGASPVPSPSPAVSSGAPQPGAANTTSGGAAAPALPPVVIDVTPPQVQVGDVTLSMALEPARHMLAQTAATTTDPDPAHPAAESAAIASTALVLDGLLRLTNNIDAAQPVPDDQPQMMIRHLNVQVRSSDGAYPVPYLSASVDMLLDGHPALPNLALVPMVASESTTPRLYYGNNLKLAQRGTYQAFVRLQPSALLGKEPPPTAQFNVVVR